MASAIGIRFVRCPKCEKVLTEFPQVPVYRCGGCDTVLRAKVRASAAAEQTVRESIENGSQNPTESSSSVNESTSLAKQTNESSLENGVQKVAQSSHHVFNSIAAHDSNGKEESKEQGEIMTKARKCEDSGPAERFVLRGENANAIAANLPVKGNQIRKEVSDDEETEKSLQVPHNSSLNQKMDKSPYSEDDIKLTSLAYDGSVSSRDEQQEDQVPHKHIPVSKRTFRNKKASSVDDSTENGTQHQAQNTPTESSNGMSSSAIRRRRSLERDTTFGSSDFHSVQNWMGSEIDEDDMITLSKNLLLRGSSYRSSRANQSVKVSYSEPDHLNILRKVDELRDELSEFLAKTEEGKRASHFKPRITQFPPSEKKSNRSCLALPHNVCCHSNPPPRVPKVPESEKQGRVKRQPVKQYLRPVYGGAPFVVCYKCWKLLHLPADFLVARKRLHKLQCGACSEVLVFSFRPRVPNDPHTPVEARHPPSEEDRISFSETSSSEPDEPVHNVSRRSSCSVQRQDRQKAKDSRLHWLMGYSSASDILFRSGRHDGGYESSGTSTPQFYRPPRVDRKRYGQCEAGTSTPKSPEIQEVDEPSHGREAVTPRGRGSALGLLKKGVREFSHGLESVKLKVHSKG